MKRGLLITVILTLLAAHFGVCSHAAIRQCDFSDPRDTDVDGSDLAQFIAHYADGNSEANVDRVGGDIPLPADVGHFAKFFGKSRLPNILLIISDDVGLDVTTGMYPDLIEDLFSLYSSKVPPHPNASTIRGTPASTPVLDQLASEGMVFSNAWAQPFCSPTRASIMTGLFTAKHNVTTYATFLGSHHTTFVRILKEGSSYGGVSYSTAAFGKWHVAGVPVNSTAGMMPKKAGFELYKGGLGAAPNSYWNNYEYVMQDDTTTDTGTKPGNLQPRALDGIASTTYAPVVKAADTIEWINARQAANPDKPWFAYLAFNLSHATSGSPMMVVPNRDTLDCHPTDTSLDGPACKEIKQCGGTFGSTAIGSCDGEPLMRAMATSMDTVIGKVLEAVDSIPFDTYVIYIADNGTPMYSFSPALGYQIGNMYIARENRGKGTSYESGARVPIAIRGPGISAGSESGEFVHAADLFSTIIELAGIEPPVDVPNSANNGTVPVDAVSLAPIIYDSTSAVRHPSDDFILTDAENIMPGSTTGGKWAGARNATYKVVCHDGTGINNCEFYNLENDPLEEYKLDEHETSSCDGVGTGTPEWHYCQLIGAIKSNSILSTP